MVTIKKEVEVELEIDSDDLDIDDIFEMLNDKLDSIRSLIKPKDSKKLREFNMQRELAVVWCNEFLTDLGYVVIQTQGLADKMKLEEYLEGQDGLQQV